MLSAPFPHPFVPTGRLLRHDPDLGHAFVADVERRVPHEHGAYFARTNAEGFREDVDLADLPAVAHVLCYGDSYAAGDGVDNSQRFTALLATRLGEPVANVAVPGHGPDQNVLQSEQLTSPRPRLILWGIAVQTIERIQSGSRLTVDRQGQLWRVGRPHFELDDRGGLELRGVPVADGGDRMIEPPCPQVVPPMVARATAVAGELRMRLVRWLAPLLKPAPDPDYRDPSSAGWRLLSALVRRFHAAADGVPVAIVPLPTARYVAEGRAPVFQARFAELARPAVGLHVLDVVTALRAAPRAERAAMHYRLDGHYTESGHRAVAAALAEQLAVHGLAAAMDRAPAGSKEPNGPNGFNGPNEFNGPNGLNGPSERRVGATLRVGWQFGDGVAEVRAADGRVLATRRESELTERPCRPGVVPLSAVHAGLEHARLAGPELAEVVLVSPGDLEMVLQLAADEPGRRALLAGWVRWHVAAERDLRRFLGFDGPVRALSEAVDGAAGGAIEGAVDGMPVSAVDVEDHWLSAALDRLAGIRDPQALRRRLLRLAHRWELATRAAREAVLPTTAPLRRGRVAHRLRRA